MKYYFVILLLVFYSGIAGQKQFTNPVIPGFNPDPSICRVGEDYYLVTSSFEFFPGVPVYHSKDLVNWQLIGHALTRTSQVDLTGVDASDGIWAPTIRHHNGTYYMITTRVQRNPWKPVNFYVTADNPAGPWSEPIYVDEGGVDPDLFFDEDGKVYYLRNGNNGIDIAEIDISSGKLKHNPVNIWSGTGAPYTEAPHMYRINGSYYLIVAEGGTGIYHRVSVARAASPLAVFKSYTFNPILYHAERFMHPIQAVGHADIIQAHDGTWWALFLAKRSTGNEVFNSVLGRETFLAPVSWTHDGWPVIGYQGLVEPQMPAPSFFSTQDKAGRRKFDFTQKNLPLDFNFVRNPVQHNYSLSRRDGWLAIKGSELTLSHQGSPTFTGIRLQHFKASVTTQLEFSPTAEDEEAGLAVYLDNNHYYSISVVRKGKKNIFQVRKKVGSLEMTLPATTNPGKTTCLRIESDENEFRLLASNDGLSFTEVGKGEAKFLHSPQYTGAYIGIFTSGNGRPTQSTAWFDWFEYVPGE